MKAPDVNEFRVIGPPGTGKTTWIEGQVRIEIERRGGGDGVLITSLTKAAAQVIVRTGLAVPKDHIGTLHGHCYRALGGGPIAETKISEFNAEYPQYRLTGENRKSIEDAEAPEAPPSGTIGDKLFAQMSFNRSTMLAPAAWAPALQRFASTWQKWKQDRGYRDFTDLIEFCYQSVAIAPNDPAVIFVDEAQDHDRLELSLLRKWARYAEAAYIVGDTDQAIYEWRGADPNQFNRPAVPADRVRILGQSYRVPRKVHDAAHKWIKQIRGRDDITYLPKVDKKTGAEEVGQIRRLGASYRRPAELLRDLEAKLKDPEKPELMILGASSFMIERLTASLRKEGIPFSNHYRKKNKQWNPLAEKKGSSPTDRVLSFLRPLETAWKEHSRIWNHPDLIKFMEPLKAGILRPGAKTAIQSYADARPVPARLLTEYFQPEALERMVKCDVAWYLESVVPNRRPAYQFPCTIIGKRGPAALELAPRLTVGTIHSVKGGEADIVYLLPDLAPSAFADWAAGGRGKESLIRLFYVAMTRARKELVLLAASSEYRVGGLM